MNGKSKTGKPTSDLICCNSATLNNYRLLYWPQLVANGNMKLVHLKMKRPEDDISLSDGEQYIVQRTRYGEHLVTGPQRQPVRLYTSMDNLSANIFEEIKVQQP